jgi:hypothetical protein
MAAEAVRKLKIEKPKKEEKKKKGGEPDGDGVIARLI